MQWQVIDDDIKEADADGYGDDYDDDTHDGDDYDHDGDATKTLIWGVLYPSFPVPIYLLWDPHCDWV